MHPLAWILLAIVALILVAIVIEALIERRERREYPPPGRLVDVGGYRLHLLDADVEQPGPTVLLEAGMVSFSSNWAWVQPGSGARARAG